MRRFKPIHGVFLVLLFVGGIVVAEMALEGRLGGAGFKRVSAPAASGMVTVDLAGLKPQEVRFFRS